MASAKNIFKNAFGNLTNLMSKKNIDISNN